MFHKRICQGLDSIGELVPVGANPYAYINPAKDAYISIYDYTDQHLAKFNEVVEKINDKTGKPYKSKRGCSGITDVTTNWFVFDFDYADKKGTSLEDARREAVQLCDRLHSLGFAGSDYLITFSGNKGFGVEFRTKERYTPEQVKEIAKYVRGESKTWDSVVYNANRIMRLPFTRHQSSGLFKIPLNYEELKTESLENIKQWASGTYEASVIPLPEVATPDDFKKALIKHEKPKLDALVGERPDLSGKPRWMSNFKYALQQGFFPPGARNNALMVLAATYRSHGWLKEHTFNILKGVAEVQAKRYTQDKYSDEKIWKEIIQTVYSDLWVGGTYAEDDFPEDIKTHLDELGVPRQSKDQEETLIENVSTGFDEFVKYANRIDEFTMQFGIPSLDEKLKVRKGHLIYILAAPGVGKTSFGVTLLNNTSKKGINSYFGSYDMYKNNVYQKLIQRHTGLSEEQIYDVFRNSEENKIIEFRNTLNKEYENVSFCFKVGQSIADLKRSVQKEEEKRGKSIELVVVDYLELILTDATDPTSASAEAAQGLRELANEGRVVVGLLQPNKMSSSPDEPIMSYNGAKGSSSIAQSATAMLTAHRPGLGFSTYEYDNYFSVNCVKNRNGPLFALDFGWNGTTQTISSLGDAELSTLVDLRKAKIESRRDRPQGLL